LKLSASPSACIRASSKATKPCRCAFPRNCQRHQKRKQSILNAAHNPPIPAEATAKDFTRAAGFRIAAMQSRRSGVSLPIRALDLPAEHL
jgi:hypothetical protein